MPDRYPIVDDQWTELAKAFEARTVLVVGDVLLDHTASGEARRLSPEAPVPVLVVDDESDGLGGAANVARNLVSLGARARLVGAVGADEAGERLFHLCRTDGIERRGVIVSNARKTTTKTRFLAHGHQVLRVDSESTELLSATEERSLIQRIAASGPVDAVIVSDYAKGAVTADVFAAALELALTCDAPCIVDPKGSDFERYTGCAIITPNAEEATAATHRTLREDADAEAIGRALVAEVGCEAVVITRGRDGVSLVTDSHARHLPAEAQEVFDVAGAGDTFVATLTLAYACNATLDDAVALANTAAGLVVRARGIVSTTRAALGRALGAQDTDPKSMEKERHAA
jgi:D-beta-D-heptose 7-phosphate kinase/D-beta-D-heptose 1-phosphate adenosyltransferase